MISDLDLFNRYKEEKALVIGSEDERTGLEDFPSFKEWKADYITEWNETHVTVDVKEADSIFDAIVNEAFLSEDDADIPLGEASDEKDENFSEDGVDLKTDIGDSNHTEASNTASPLKNLTEENDMSNKTETTATSKPAAKKPTRKTQVKKPAASKPAAKTTKKPAASKKPAAKKTSAKKPATKASKAARIFARFYESKSRSEVIAKFVAQAGLTKAGASTYYQNLKKAHIAANES